MNARRRIATAVTATFAIGLAGCGGPPPPDPRKDSREEGLNLGLQLPDPVVVQKPRVCGLFLPDPAAATFAFDGGSAQGFVLDGVYDDTNPQAPVRVAVLNVGAAWDDTTNAPTAAGVDPLGNGHGAAYFIKHPQLDVAPRGTFRRIDFVTPGLGNVWQGKGQYSYDVLDHMSFGGAKLQAQLVLHVRKCDGTEANYQAVDANHQPVFCPISGDRTWTHCTASVVLANVDTVLGARLRVFVPGGQLYEGGVYLDNLHAE